MQLSGIRLGFENIFAFLSCPQLEVELWSHLVNRRCRNILRNAPLPVVDDYWFSQTGPMGYSLYFPFSLSTNTLSIPVVDWRAEESLGGRYVLGSEWISNIIVYYLLSGVPSWTLDHFTIRYWLGRMPLWVDPLYVCRIRWLVTFTVALHYQLK